MRRYLVALLVASTLGAAVRAQEMRFFYAAPDPAAVEVLKDQSYGGGLQMDVYRPARGERTMLPAVVFFNMATGANRSNTFYRSWAQLAAAQGLVAVLPDLRSQSFEQDFDAAVAHLTSTGASLGLDRDRIAVYAGSGNVWRALPLLQNPARTAIKSAVMYYGVATVPAFRRDLPLLLVRAGLDRPPVNRGLTELAAQAAKENAPVTLVNYPGGHHAFEIVDDEEATREVIDSTVAYIKRTTMPSYQASLRQGVPEATAAAYVATGDFARAAASYAELVKAQPDDTRLRLSYGEALLGDSQFVTACAELAKLKGKGLGPRDLGLPAARACMQSGDGDAALAWLKTIPSQYLPPDVENDPIFAALQSRPEFKALFKNGVSDR
jgi:dienelactone hydrolase